MADRPALVRPDAAGDEVHQRSTPRDRSSVLRERAAGAGRRRQVIDVLDHVARDRRRDLGAEPALLDHRHHDVLRRARIRAGHRGEPRRVLVRRALRGARSCPPTAIWENGNPLKAQAAVPPRTSPIAAPCGCSRGLRGEYGSRRSQRSLGSFHDARRRAPTISVHHVRPAQVPAVRDRRVGRGELQRARGDVGGADHRQDVAAGDPAVREQVRAGLGPRGVRHETGGLRRQVDAGRAAEPELPEVGLQELAARSQLVVDVVEVELPIRSRRRPCRTTCGAPRQAHVQFDGAQLWKTAPDVSPGCVYVVVHG